MRKALSVILLVVILLCFISVACGKSTDYHFDGVPDEITTFYISRNEASKESFEKIESYTYWPDDTMKKFVKENFVPISDYEVESGEKINENLYVFVIIHTVEGRDYYTRGYNFVGVIDGELKVIPNANWVPDELSDGVDLSSFIQPDSL